MPLRRSWRPARSGSIRAGQHAAISPRARDPPIWRPIRILGAVIGAAQIRAFCRSDAASAGRYPGRAEPAAGDPGPLGTSPLALNGDPDRSCWRRWAEPGDAEAPSGSSSASEWRAWTARRGGPVASRSWPAAEARRRSRSLMSQRRRAADQSRQRRCRPGTMRNARKAAQAITAAPHHGRIRPCCPVPLL